MDAAHSSSLPLPLPLPQTYAPWPVWSDSTTAPIRFAPMPKKAVVRLSHRGRDFDRGTHEHGRHGGAVGPTALQGSQRAVLAAPPHLAARCYQRGR